MTMSDFVVPRVVLSKIVLFRYALCVIVMLVYFHLTLTERAHRLTKMYVTLPLHVAGCIRREKFTGRGTGGLGVYA